MGVVNLGIQNLAVVGDPVLVIKAIKGVCKMSWHATTIIKDLQILLNRFIKTTTHHFHCEEN